MMTTTIIIILINNVKIISLNKGIKTQFLFNISNELFCFSNKLSEITVSIIKVTFTSIIICNNDFIKMMLSAQSN